MRGLCSNSDYPTYPLIGSRSFKRVSTISKRWEYEDAGGRRCELVQKSVYLTRTHRLVGRYVIHRSNRRLQRGQYTSKAKYKDKQARTCERTILLHRAPLGWRGICVVFWLRLFQSCAFPRRRHISSFRINGIKREY